MLYVVPTPLGNLEDITQRAVRALRESQLILCEDTRRTKILLSHLGIHAAVERYEDRRPHERLLEQLRAGKTMSLVSDGGTPVISDPGVRLVAEARAAGLPVSSLPGPCAAAAAVAGSGLPGDSFVFLGFLPRTRGKRIRYLTDAKALERTVVVYESPMRILELLSEAREVFGPNARAAAARELTKVHEEWLTGTVGEVEAALSKRDKILGEFVLVLREASHGEDH